MPRFVDRAHLRGADAIMLDLEDSIPAAEKAAARAALAEAVARVARGGADVVVRINKPYDLALADLDAAVRPASTRSACRRPRARARSRCSTR